MPKTHKVSLYVGTRAGVRACMRASVRPSVCVSTLSNMNISETSGPIAIKFYVKHHLGRGKAALGFEADRFRTLDSMATHKSHKFIIGKTVPPIFLGCF